MIIGGLGQQIFWFIFFSSFCDLAGKIYQGISDHPISSRFHEFTFLAKSAGTGAIGYIAVAGSKNYQNSMKIEHVS